MSRGFYLLYIHTASAQALWKVRDGIPRQQQSPEKGQRAPQPTGPGGFHLSRGEWWGSGELENMCPTSRQGAVPASFSQAWACVGADTVSEFSFLFFY